MKIIRYYALLFFITPIFLLGQTEQYEQKLDAKGKYQLVDVKSGTVLFDKCASIKSLTGDFTNTDESYKKILLIKQGKHLIIFDSNAGKTVESIKCDSITFYEVRDGWSEDQIMSKSKKKVICGKIRSKKKHLNNLILLMNVQTMETRGLYPELLDVKYDRYRSVVVVEAGGYSILRDENFKNLFPILQNLRQYENGFFMGKNSTTKLYGVIDRNMEEVIPFNYMQISEIDNMLYAAKNNFGKVGMIKEGGQIVIPFNYNCIEESYTMCNILIKKLTKGFYLLSKEDKLVVIDSSNQIIITPGQYRDITYFKNKFVWIKSHGGLWGVFDLENKKEVISCEYEKINSFGEHVLAEKNGKLGVLDLYNSKIIVPLIYETNYKTFKNKDEQFYIFETGGRKGVVSEKGEQKIPFIFDDIISDKDYLLIKHKGLYGLYDKYSFKEILPIEFTKINTKQSQVEKLENGVLKKGSYTKAGEIKWEN